MARVGSGQVSTMGEALPYSRKTKRRPSVTKRAKIFALICAGLAAALVFCGLYLKQQETIAANASEAANYKPAPATAAASKPSSQPEPVVVFSFDDGYTADYDVVRPILAEKGISGTFGVITSLVGTNYRLTWEQVREMAAEGHDIANHSATHVTLATADQPLLDAEIAAAHQTMVNNGITPSGYVYPYGQFNDAAQTEVERLYQYGLGGDGGSVYETSRVNLGTGDDVNALKARVDQAEAAGETLIFLNHSGTALDESGQAILREVIDYVQSKEIDILTAKEALERTAGE